MKIFYRKYLKRVLDLALASVLIILFSWLLLIISISILVFDGKPVAFLQERVGFKGKLFKIYKFRTMTQNAEKIGPKYTEINDNRITKIGSFLRKTSLDELPQLFNVLKGDMSFVGYRPGVPENYESKDYESGMFDVRPGITGYAQINGRSMLNVEEKRKLELKYTEDISFCTDLKILVGTLKAVFREKDLFNFYFILILEGNSGEKSIICFIWRWPCKYCKFGLQRIGKKFQL